MTSQEIITLMEQIKILLPTIAIPDIANKTKEEREAIMAVYIMQFGNLNYHITLNALNKITQDETKMKEFSKAPIPTLARESTNLTQFTIEEKQKYKDSQSIRYWVDKQNKMMRATNKLTGKAIPEKDRPMTAIEEDYWIYYKMFEDEYDYWVAKERGKQYDKKPEIMRYNPKTRQNDYNPSNEILTGFKPIGA